MEKKAQRDLVKKKGKEREREADTHTQKKKNTDWSKNRIKKKGEEKNKYPKVQQCVPNYAKIEKEIERKIVKERLLKKYCER